MGSAPIAAGCIILSMSGRLKFATVFTMPPGILVTEVGAGSTRMGGDCDGRLPVRREFALQLVREEEVGELALEVRHPRAVFLLTLQVVEVDRAGAVAHRTDRDHTRVFRGEEMLEQMTSEGEGREVVDPELHLETLCRCLMGQCHQSGVVDQHVETVVVGKKLLCRGGHGVEIAQVDVENLERRIRGDVRDRRDRGIGFGSIATRQHHVRTVLRERPRRFVPDPAVGTRDHDHAPRQIRNVTLTPALIHARTLRPQPKPRAVKPDQLSNRAVGEAVHGVTEVEHAEVTAQIRDGVVYGVADQLLGLAGERLRDGGRGAEVVVLLGAQPAERVGEMHRAPPRVGGVRAAAVQGRAQVDDCATRGEFRVRDLLGLGLAARGPSGGSPEPLGSRPSPG